ncbi:MAG: hypothetical protein KIS66_03230 [Fimbriimonadaceae bacterium]|nr:hypothetical protein [Fimbriimonadaceae bacterium]
MNRFAEAVEAYEAAPDDARRVVAWRAYFEGASDADAAAAVRWLVAPWRSRFTRGALVDEVRDRAGLPDWLFSEALRGADDTAEGLSRLLGTASGERAPDLADGLAILQGGSSLGGALHLLAALDPSARWPYFKRLLGGRLGIGIDHLAEAIAEVRSVSRVSVARWLMAGSRSAPGWSGVFEGATDAAFGPLPFARIVPYSGDGGGQVADYLWPGRRIQAVRDAEGTFCWSEDFHQVAVTSSALMSALLLLPPGTVLEGVLSPDGRDMVVVDALFEAGEDLRAFPLSLRRARLRGLVREPLRCPDLIEEAPGGLEARRAHARGLGACGLILKRADAAYGARPAWQTWRSEPVTVCAVLLYAQRGAGRYELPTFGVWSGDQPTPFAKTAQGLPESERDLIDRYVRNNAVERSGPVLAVLPEWVYEIAVEEVWPSTRHRCGLKVAKAHVVRRRPDLNPGDADTLATVRRRLGLPE